MRKLYYQVYATIVVSLVLVVLIIGGLWRFLDRHEEPGQLAELIRELAGAALGPATNPIDQQAQALRQLAAALKTDLSLYDRDGRNLAHAGAPLALPAIRRGDESFTRGAFEPTRALQLGDGRWLVAKVRFGDGPSEWRIALVLGGVVIGIAMGAHPIARRLTRRLERLQKGVDTFGAGDLKARVRVNGRDEVARLAQSFNRAADRIEQLVDAHKMLLASASHELRTPLARVRLGIELLLDKPDPARRREVERDIAELDRLIEDMLLASRLGAGAVSSASESVDLLALVAEEGARFAAVAVSGEPAIVEGDPALLRRLIRNLLDNAEKHGRPPVEIHVATDDGRAKLRVSDAGVAIPEFERARMFEPFYRIGGEKAGRATRGLGLGLSLVRDIARRHGGSVEYVPSAQATSVFVVSLPLVRTPAAAKAPERG